MSGDYFDYKRLDEQHYALIKVDVSGKGVSAALIMIEVATIFQTYFKHWTLQSPGCASTGSPTRSTTCSRSAGSRAGSPRSWWRS